MARNYIVEGMVSMLRSGEATVDMYFEDLRAACSEPELHEFDSIEDMRRNWHEAKIEYQEEK